MDLIDRKISYEKGIENEIIKAARDCIFILINKDEKRMVELVKDLKYNKKTINGAIVLLHELGIIGSKLKKE